MWHAGLPGTPLPRFTEGTRGFGRVDDTDAEGGGLARYSADAGGADLAFLGWFSPLTGNMHYEPGEVTIDIWVDADGRVRHSEEVSRHQGESRVVTRFDRFDALSPIDLPFDEGDDVPAATRVSGISVVGCGDPALG